LAISLWLTVFGTFLDGRVGSDPTKASVENGKVLIQLVADAVAEDFRGFMDS